jgi:hypothetical protein
MLRIPKKSEPINKFQIQKTMVSGVSVYIPSRILHESEASIGKAFKGEAIVNYASLLITQHMGASGLPEG